MPLNDVVRVLKDADDEHAATRRRRAIAEIGSCPLCEGQEGRDAVETLGLARWESASAYEVRGMSWRVSWPLPFRA